MFRGTLKWMSAAAAVAISLGARSAGAAVLPAGPMTPAAISIPTWTFVSFDILVLAMLAAASVAGIALAIQAIMHVRESQIAPPKTTEHLRTLIASRQYQDLLDFTATDKTFVSQALNAALKRAHLKYPVMHDALETSIGEQSSEIMRKLEPLNVIGNMGPLLGLLGTVLGMIMAFYALMNKGGAANAADLAGGIGTALWHTFLGLMVAIPCLVVYGFYRTRADSLNPTAASIAEELLEMLRPEPTDEPAKRRRPTREREPAPEPEAAIE